MARNDTKRDKVITALLTCRTLEGAAKAAGIGRRTLYRYLEDPVFRKELREKRNALMDSALDSIRGKVQKAVDQLDALMDCEDDRTRRLACKDLIDYSLRIKESQDMEERLEAIEKLLNNI